MKELHPEDYDRLIIEEMRLAARELVAEAWQEGALAGIEPELLAEEMVQAVVTELARERGVYGATQLTDRIVRLADEGRLLAPRRLQ